tara:strand:+ start:352 stop:1383 length:1032 start_codon:yes stop_codon:yes gene_type:complete
MSSSIEYNTKIVSIWLKGSIFLIFVMVIVGGFTRLTDSGLSITEWELFSGIIPPLSTIEWKNYFDEYKKIPQYQLLFPGMTLDEFKYIFFWEYFHRLLGRVIGLFFIIPLLYFTFKKAIKMNYLYIFYFVFFLICLQGFFGWYMVQSGLVNDVTVSHYRLSIHLFTAVLIISILYWNYLCLSKNINRNFFSNDSGYIILKIFFFLILIQVIFGAFVSGLDAGSIYQTWPKMNNSFFPDDTHFTNIYDMFNFENHSLVQFYHRKLAYIIFFFFCYLSYKIFKKKIIIDKKIFLLVSIILLVQILLGIVTLISGLNIYLAIFHQIFSLVLVLSVLRLNFYSAKHY